MMRRFDYAVVGAGIVGLATAWALKKRNPQARVAVLEAESRVAKHQTGNNSGVIHAGLYYKPGSKKAELCTRGRESLYDFCREYGVAHENCGKVVVAVTEAELPKLEELERRGHQNGLVDIKRLTGAELKEREPHLAGVAGLHVPYTGIVDYVQMAETLAQQIRESDGEILTSARVREIDRSPEGIRLVTESTELDTAFLINCAGLYSDKVAQLAGLKPRVRILPFRGEYYRLVPERESLVRNLIYPVPDPRFPFLGVHFTRMVGGGIEAGPNAVFAFKREGYRKTSFSLRESFESVTSSAFINLARRYFRTGVGEFWRSLSKRAFVHSLQRLIPEIRVEDVYPEGAGVRAQAVTPEGQLVDDFAIEEAEDMIHVLNAPSPAATASLAIGEEIAARVER